MKNLNVILGLYFFGAVVANAQFHTNTITTPNDVLSFSVDGSPPVNPTIELEAGVTNILDIQTYPDHPVIIITADTSEFYTGADPQDVTNVPISLTTPSTNFPTTLYYVCAIHGFYGQIHFSVGAPLPNTILQVRVGTNIVMTSTGTQTFWHFVPEFSSNLVTGTWGAVPGFTNSFDNGTNTTVFDRLDPICGPNVFLRVRQSPN
jgi:hypothetical protein